MGQSYAFDPATKLTENSTLSSYATISAGWLEEQRKVADDGLTYQSTLFQRSFEAFTRVTGVNLDEELA